MVYLTIFITIIILNQLLQSSEKELWCYCTVCPEGLGYCTTKGGVCFKERLLNSGSEYGCWTRNESYSKCPVAPNTFFPTHEHLIVPRMQCCDNQDWCNSITKILETTGMNLMDTELETNMDKLSCFCNVCGSNKNCRTDGMCMRDETRSRQDPDYGCISRNFVNSSCQAIYTSLLSRAPFNPNVLCCDGEKWCNFDQTDDTEVMTSLADEFAIRSIRFERRSISELMANYSLLIRNRILTKMTMSVEALLTTNAPIPQIISNGRLEFEARMNRLYKFNFTPMVRNEPITSQSQSIYFTRMFGFSASWFPSDLLISPYVRTVILCRVCEEAHNNFECQNCQKHEEGGNNPIWFHDIYNA